MLDDIYRRVQERLEAVGLKPSAASKLAGLTEDAIRNMERAVKAPSGRKGVSTDTLERLAPVLKTTPGWLFSGGMAPAVMVGRVGAGANIASIADHEREIFDLPASDHETQAFLVKGSSCEPILEDGDVIIVHDRPAAPKDFLNRLCVVDTVDGLGYVKIVRTGMTVPGRDKLYKLESPNPETDELPLQAIKRARPVVLRIIKGGR